jgi:hypothetical protein
MGFNPTKFAKQKFQSREADVEVSALGAWFDAPAIEEGEAEVKPLYLWRVRGLEGHEFAKMMASAQAQANLSSIIEAIGNNGAKIKELKDAIGIGEETPADLQKRLQQLVLGSVDPKVDEALAAKLAKTFPIEFYMITNKITELTGLGLDVKK